MLNDAALVGILALGAFSFSLAGFGFALVSVPLLALMMPVKTAVAFQFPLSLALTIYHAFKFRADFELRRLWFLLSGACLTIPLGIWSLDHCPEMIMKRLLAAFIVIMVLVTRFRMDRKMAAPKFRGGGWAVAWGAVSGWFQGAYTTGGPPVVIYTAAVSEGPKAAKGLLGAYFATAFVITGGLFAVSGVFTRQCLLMSLCFSPAALIGAALGTLVARRISPGSYRRAVDLLLIAAAVLLWLG